MALTETRIKAMRPADRPFKVSDREGLYLLVTNAGAKCWRLNYRFAGKQQTLALGTWPDVDLLAARSKCQKARDQLRQGENPAVTKKTAKQIGATPGTTFAAIADEVITKLKDEGKAPRTVERAERMRALAVPVLGERGIASIAIQDVFGLLQGVANKGHRHTAMRLRAFIGRVFLQAILTSRATVNPAADLGKALPSPQAIPRAAVLDPKGVGVLMLAIWDYGGQPVVGYGLRLLALTFVRPGELRFAEWPEFDLDNATWTIPATHSKMKREHLVPLSTQALEVLRMLKALTGGTGYVLPSVTHRGRPISENTLNAAIRRMGYTKEEACAHGLRSTASTLLNESGLFRPDVIERQLAHIDSNSVRRAYNRAEFWPERVKLMQWWGDHLDALRAADPLFLPAMETGTQERLLTSD